MGSQVATACSRRAHHGNPIFLALQSLVQVIVELIMAANIYYFVPVVSNEGRLFLCLSSEVCFSRVRFVYRLSVIFRTDMPVLRRKLPERAGTRPGSYYVPYHNNQVKSRVSQVSVIRKLWYCAF